MLSRKCSDVTPGRILNRTVLLFSANTTDSHSVVVEDTSDSARSKATRNGGLKIQTKAANRASARRSKKAIKPQPGQRSHSGSRVVGGEDELFRRMLPERALSSRILAASSKNNGAVDPSKGETPPSANNKLQNLRKRQPIQRNTFNHQNLGLIAKDEVEEKGKGFTDVDQQSFEHVSPLGSFSLSLSSGGAPIQTSCTENTIGPNARITCPKNLLVFHHRGTADVAPIDAPGMDSYDSMERRYQQDDGVVETIKIPQQHRSYSKRKRHQRVKFSDMWDKDVSPRHDVNGDIFRDLQSHRSLESSPPSETCEQLSVNLEPSESLIPSLYSEHLSVNSVTMRDIFGNAAIADEHGKELGAVESTVRDSFETRAAEARSFKSSESECCQDRPTNQLRSRLINFNHWRSYYSGDDLEVRVIPSRATKRSSTRGSSNFSVEENCTQTSSNSISDPHPIFFDF